MIREEWKDGKLIAPSVNIVETDDNYVMEAFMPGVRKDGIEVKLAEGELTIYGKFGKPQNEDATYLLKEAEEGNYYRLFRIGEVIDVSKISAKIEHGILTVTLPKHERVKPREIPIQIE